MWTVLPHGPLQQLTPRLWRVEGSLPRIPLPRNMILWRDDAGGLLAHSPIAVDASTRQAIEALGPVHTVVVPSPQHRLDAPAWADRYPEARVTCPAAAREAVEARVAVDATVEQALEGVRVLQPAGLKAVELVYEVDAGDGTRALVFNDQVFHLRQHLPGFHGAILRWITGSTGFFGLSRLGAWFLLRDRAAYREWLAEQADRDDVGVITMSHGEPVRGADACRAHLHEAASRL